MAVVVGRMVAVLEAQTTQFEARLSAASQQLTRMDSASLSAHRGASVLRGGLQQLAFSAAGLPGPLGRITAGLLTLGGGTGLMLLVAAAAGTLTLAYNALMASSKEAAKAQEDFTRALAATGAQGKELVASMALAAAQSKLANMESRQAAAEYFGRQYTLGLFSSVGGYDPKTLQAARDAVTKAQDALSAATREATEATRRQRRAIEDHIDQLVALRERLGPISGPASLINWRGTKTEGFWDKDTMPKIPGREFFNDPLYMLSKQGGKVSPPKFQIGPEFGQMLLFSFMQAQQGNALGGIGTGITALAGMKGIGAAAAGPLGWIGFGISALATIFGQKSDEAARQRERLHRELIGALREGPQRISQYFEGDPEASLYQNRRLERLGGEPRNGGL